MTKKSTGSGKKKATLNRQQKAFCEYYLGESMGNATHAAKKAGYSEKSAYTIGQKLTKHDEVKEYLKKRSGEKFEEIRADAYDIMNKLKVLADFNSQDCFDKKGNLIPISKLPREVAYAISGFETIRKKDGEEFDTLDKIKTINKEKILETLAKILKLYEDNMPKNVKITVKITK